MATGLGLIAIMMWGLLAVLTVYTRQVPPFQLLAVCFAIAFALMLVSQMVQGRKPGWPQPLPLAHWLVHAGCLFGFHACYFFAIRYAPAMQVSLIGYLWPLLLGILIAAPGLRRYALTGGLCGLAGAAVLVTGGQALSIEPAYVTGYVLALLCALIWAGYSWFLSRTASSPLHIGWVALLVAGLAWAMHLGIEETFWPTDGSGWLAMLLLGLGPIGGAFYLWDAGMKGANPGLLASCSFATPVISAGALFFAGHSPLTNAVLIPVCLITLGAVICQQAARLQRWRRFYWGQS